MSSDRQADRVMDAVWRPLYGIFGWLERVGILQEAEPRKGADMSIETRTLPVGPMTKFLAERLVEAEERAKGTPEGDPVWRELDAKHAILAEYDKRDEDVDLMLGDECLRQREWAGLRLAVRHLVAIYRDHPDYDPEWTP